MANLILNSVPRAFTALPFATPSKFTGTESMYWNLPATGGYAGGCEAGAAMAVVFAKHLRGGTNWAEDNALAQIMGSMQARAGEAGAEDAALQGQRVGFLVELQRLMAAALRVSDDRVGLMDEAQLVRRVEARWALCELVG